MDNIKLKARAKINLSLDVLRRRPDGYHEVRMVMQTLELHDEVELLRTEEGIAIECASQWVPKDSRNIAYKAAKLLMDRFDIRGGLKIIIKKNIPVAAGLAGGSTDAAAVLQGMNRLYDLGLTPEELMVLGKQIGADVPFCIRGGTMLSEGIGEILTSLPPFSGVDIVLVKPKIGVSTEWVYKNLELSSLKERPDTALMTKLIEKRDIRGTAENMKNVLESVTVKKHAVIDEIKRRLMEAGALGSMMSGSGPTVFGIFGDSERAAEAYESLKSERWECILTRTINNEEE